MLWCKLQSLVKFDPGVWLEESARLARGEAPYRDFLWNYPPLGLAAIAYPLRFMGISFSVAQTVIDILSLAIVFLVFCVLGYLVSRALRIWICLLVIAVGATTQTYFSLFSLLSYSPALHMAAVGLLLLLLGALRYLAEAAAGHKIPKTAVVLLVAGSWIALMSKQESFLVAPVFLILLALFDPNTPGAARGARWSGIFAAALLPPIAAYLLLGKAVGFANLFDALRGYGLATVPCPWWPTGLGIFGALAALGTAAFVIGTASLFDRSRWRQALGSRRYTLLLAAAAAGCVIWIGYEWYADGPLLLGPSSLAARLLSFSKAAFATSPVLRPVLWSAMVYWLVLLVGLIRGPVRPPRLQLLLLLTVPVLIGVRSLFGSTLAPTPEVPALSYPFLSMLGPYLLLRGLELPAREAGALRVHGGRVAMRITSTLVISYVILRVAAAYPVLFSNRTFTSLATESGFVRVHDGNVDAALYRYVLHHTRPGDYFLELPYGGGLTFATRRSNPVFSTQFAGVPIPERFQLADLARIRNNPPSLIVAADQPHFGTFWGIPGNMACVAPRLTWIPDRPSWNPELVFPLTQFIENNYRTEQKIGPWLVLRLKSD